MHPVERSGADRRTEIRMRGTIPKNRASAEARPVTTVAADNWEFSSARPDNAGRRSN